MTYLQLVNSVLRRLREDQVSTVSQNSYSLLIGEFINDAKRTVEDAYNWTALRKTITVTTSDAAYTYPLVGSQNQATLLSANNQTQKTHMQYRGTDWMNNAYLIETPATGVPQFYNFKGVDTNGDTTVDVYPKPNGVYELGFNVVQRTEAFEEDTDSLLAPSAPVIQVATALGARERGETGGTSAAELFAIADNTLADAIALDASQHPEETIWYS